MKKLKWVRRSEDDPNAILCIYGDNDDVVFLDWEQINQLKAFIAAESLKEQPL